MAQPLRFGILTLSDRSAAGQRPDASGPALVEAVRKQGWLALRQEVLPDELEAIAEILMGWSGSGDLDVILTTGGTGFGSRDVTPEATLSVVQRLAPGIAEAIRSASLMVTPHAMLSRGVAGICQRTLIINLPGSPKGALESLEVILPVLQHAVDLLREAPEAETGHSHINSVQPPSRPTNGEEHGLSA
jgi:molybdopterin adenylyltransferase